VSSHSGTIVAGAELTKQNSQSASTVDQNYQIYTKNRSACQLLPMKAKLTLQVVQTSSLQIDFARLWTQCQRCQGSLHQDVICTSADCPIFYRRTARQKEVTASVAQLDRFEKETTW
jgi:hypothetical protein